VTILDLLPEPNRSAYKAAAAEIKFPYLYGDPVARVPLSTIERNSSFQKAHQQDQLRNVCLWILCHHLDGQTYGFGQMDRDRARAELQARLYPNQFSPPITSFHVEDIVRHLLAIACDTVGTGRAGAPPDRFASMRKRAASCGLFLVPAENEWHHTQCMPGSKRGFNAPPGQYWGYLKQPDFPRLPDRFYKTVDALGWPTFGWPAPPLDGMEIVALRQRLNYWAAKLIGAAYLRVDETAADHDYDADLQFAVRQWQYYLVSVGRAEAKDCDGWYGPRTAMLTWALMQDISRL
jgi:hypothetical protein